MQVQVKYKGVSSHSLAWVARAAGGQVQLVMTCPSRTFLAVQGCTSRSRPGPAIHAILVLCLLDQIRRREEDLASELLSQTGPLQDGKSDDVVYLHGGFCSITSCPISSLHSQKTNEPRVGGGVWQKSPGKLVLQVWGNELLLAPHLTKRHNVMWLK